MIDAVLINGVTLPYHLLDKGVQRSRDEGSSVRVIFMYKYNKKNKQPPINAVLTKPDFTERKANQNLETLIRTNILYVQSFFRRKSIEIETVVLPNPDVEAVVKLMDDVNFVFVDQNTFSHPRDFAFVDFPYLDLEAKLTYKLHF